MLKDTKLDKPTLQGTESGLRMLLDKAEKLAFKPIASLSEAKRTKAHLVMEGDCGGQIYLTIPTTSIKCSERDLKSLLMMIDAIQWGDPLGAAMYFKQMPIGKDMVPGGMGGGTTTRTLWAHEYYEAIHDFISSKRPMARKLLKTTT